MGFREMGFEEAVSYVNSIGALSGVLWLLLPASASIAIRRRRRNSLARQPWLAYGVMPLWLASIAAMVMSLRSGAWYGENGPPPQVAAAQVTESFLLLLALHGALLIGAYYRSAAQIPWRQEWPIWRVGLSLLVVATLGWHGWNVNRLEREDRQYRDEQVARILRPPQLDIAPDGFFSWDADPQGKKSILRLLQRPDGAHVPVAQDNGKIRVVSAPGVWPAGDLVLIRNVRSGVTAPAQVDANGAVDAVISAMKGDPLSIGAIVFGRPQMSAAMAVPGKVPAASPGGQMISPPSPMH